MLKRTLCFLLALSMSLPWKAHSSALRCESVFIPTFKEVLETVNRESNQYLFAGKSLKEHQESLSWIRRRKIRKILNSLEIEQVPSQARIEQYAVEMGTLLFGHREYLSRWIRKNGQERMEESTTLLIKERLLKEGVLKVWGEHNDPATLSVLNKMMDRVWRFQHSRVMEFAGIPYWLPKAKDKALSQELIFKVVRDGYKAHEKEIAVALKSQNYREAYNTFARLYKPVVFALIFVFLLQKTYDDYETSINDAVEDLVKGLEEQRKSIENLPEIKVDEAETAFQQALVTFKEQWGEDPTPAERLKIQTQIETALGVPAGTLKSSPSVR